MIALDFKCPYCNHKSEELVEDKEVQPACPRCHTFMERSVQPQDCIEEGEDDKIQCAGP